MRTALVELNGTLSHLGISTQLVPAKVKGSVMEVSLGFNRTVTEGILVSSPGSSILILVGSLHHSPGGDHLSPNHTREVVQGGKARWNVLSSREADSSVGDEVSGDGKHGDAAMLELDPAKTVELVLVGIGHHSEGIPEAEGHLGAELFGEVGIEGGAGGLSNLGGGEGSGRASKGSEECELHHFGVCC